MNCRQTNGYLTAGLFALLMSSKAASAAVSPPVGYIGLNQTFVGVGAEGLSDVTFSLNFGSLGAQNNGTFWANDFSFAGTEGTTAFPDNYAGGAPGGYVGLQQLADGTQIAIFSVFWGDDADSANPEATIVESIEIWYLDDAPFDPPITSLDDIDTTRQTAGGPFHSVRVPVRLIEGLDYNITLERNADASATWWSAALSDGITQTGIGRIAVPGNWDGLSRVGGFIEHFGPLPEDCASIPQSDTTIAAAKSSAGKATLGAYLYGACEADLFPRTEITCDTATCRAEIQAVIPLPLSALSLLSGLAGLGIAGRNRRGPVLTV